MVKKISKRRVFSTLTALLMATSMATPLATAVSADAGEQSFTQRTEDYPYRNILYYGDWSIWGGQGSMSPLEIPGDLITHLNFAFIDVKKDGSLGFCDRDAAINSPAATAFPTGWSNGGMPCGIIPGFMLLRQAYPNLKIGFSLGGWSKSNNFTWVARDDATLDKFIDNVIELIDYSDFDFVDVDWEYPASVRQPDPIDNKNDAGTPDSIPEDKENYTKLMVKLRAALDELEVKNNKKYELSAALAASPNVVENGLDVEGLFKVLDYGNLMTYDMNGAYSNLTGHQSALYGNPDNPAEWNYSCDGTAKLYQEQGAPAHKLTIGVCMYTRGWGNVPIGSEPDPTLPGLHTKAEIAGPNASNWGANATDSYGALNSIPTAYGDGGYRMGLYEYRNIGTKADYSGSPVPTALAQRYPTVQKIWDDAAKAHYFYVAPGEGEPGNQATVLSGDTPESVAEKGKYVRENGLGGLIAWMSSQDGKNTDGRRSVLTQAMKESLYGTDPLPNFRDEGEMSAANLDIDYLGMEFLGDVSAWNKAQAVALKFKNNETLTSTDPVAKEMEKYSKSYYFPTFYVKTNVTSGLTTGGYDFYGGTAPKIAHLGEGLWSIAYNHSGVSPGNLPGNANFSPGKEYTLKFVAPAGTTADSLEIEYIDVAGSLAVNVTQIPNANAPVKSQRVFPADGAGANAYIYDFEIPGMLESTVLNDSIIVVMPSTTNIPATQFSPIVKTSSNTSVSPASGTAQNFADIVEYTVTSGSISKTYKVNVINALGEAPPVEDKIDSVSVSVNPSTVDTNAGAATAKATATVFATGTISRTYKLEISGIAGATIDATGNISVPQGTSGTLTITATSEADPTKIGTATLTVTNESVPSVVTGITADASNVTIEVGKTATVTATVNGTGDFDNSVTWTSADPSVATVANGVITGVAAGTTEITVASVSDPSIKATISVTVSATPVAPEVTGITVDVSNITVKEGETTTIVPQINGVGDFDKTINWTSSDETIAKVVGGVVTAVKEGTAVITLSSAADPTKTATVTVTVTPPSSVGDSVILGDVNLSGGVDISDALKIFRCMAGIDPALDAKQLFAADITEKKDGSIGIEEALSILKWYAGVSYNMGPSGKAIGETVMFVA